MADDKRSSSLHASWLVNSTWNVEEPQFFTVAVGQRRGSLYGCLAVGCSGEHLAAVVRKYQDRDSQFRALADGDNIGLG
jgi:hypothetical protein